MEVPLSCQVPLSRKIPLSRSLILSLALCTLGVGVYPATGQDEARFARWLWRDAVGLGARALPLSPVFLTAGGLVIPAGKQIDEDLAERLQRGYSGAWADYLDVMNDFGGRHMWIPASSIFAVSLLTDNEKFQDAAFTSVESLIASVTITAAVKQVIGRARPEENEGPLHLRPFSGSVSFPSGHTTLAFAIVSPWVFYYPGPLTYSLFVLSTSTGVARIAKSKHWPTDVLAGAAVGILTGRWLSRRHQDASQSNITVTPRFGLNSVGVTIRVR